MLSKSKPSWCLPLVPGLSPYFLPHLTSTSNSLLSTHKSKTGTVSWDSPNAHSSSKSFYKYVLHTWRNRILALSGTALIGNCRRRSLCHWVMHWEVAQDLVKCLRVISLPNGCIKQSTIFRDWYDPSLMPKR